MYRYSEQEQLSDEVNPYELINLEAEDMETEFGNWCETLKGLGYDDNEIFQMMVELMNRTLSKPGAFR